MYDKFEKREPFALLDTSKYPPEVAGRFNSFITTQFDDSLSVEMQMRSIIKWAIGNFDETVNQTNHFIDFINDLIEYMNEFVETFDTKFQEEILLNLQKWNDDGTLATLINESLDTKYHEMDEKFTTQLAQTLKHGEVSVSDIDKNKGKFDQTYMSDAFLQQMVGDTPINAVPEDGSITTKKTAYRAITPYETDFVKTSTNLFNKDDENNLPNTGIDLTTGEPIANEQAMLTGFLPIKSTVSYTLSASTRIAFYDESYNFIKSDVFSNPYTPTVPENASFSRLVVLNTLLETAQMNIGTVLLPYESYHQEIDKELLPIVESDDIKDRAITSEKVSFINKSSNLFNKDDVLTGYGIDTETGELIEVSTAGVTNFVRIKPATYYTTISGVRLAFYDINKVFISSNVYHSGNLTVASPNNAYYARFVYLLTKESKVQVNEGQSLLPHEEYYEKIDEKYIPEIQNKSSSTPFFVPEVPNYDYITTDKPNARGEEGSDFHADVTTSAEVIAKYDELLNEFPDYITKTLLGYDESGTLPIYKYDFNPSRANQSGTPEKRKPLPKVLMTNGVHGHFLEEPPATTNWGDPPIHVYSGYYLFEDLCRNWKTNKAIEYMRFNVRFSVIPIVNPWGFDNHSRLNFNSVDLNRNADNNWTSGHHKGSEPFSEAESKIIRDFILNEKDDYTVFYLDIHSLGGMNFVADRTLTNVLVPSKSIMYLPLEHSIRKQSRIWVKQDVPFVDDLEVYGRIQTLSSTPHTFTWVEEVVGIPSFLTEHFVSTNYEAEQSIPKYDALTMNMNVEFLGNFIIDCLNFCYKNQ